LPAVACCFHRVYLARQPSLGLRELQATQRSTFNNNCPQGHAIRKGLLMAEVPGFEGYLDDENGYAG
jgi:hypothetical protein